MKVKRFFAPDMRQAMKLVREEFGSDAAILSNNKVAGGVEIVTAVDYDASVLRQPASDLSEDQPDALTESLADALAKARDVIDQAQDDSGSVSDASTQLKRQNQSLSQRENAEAMVGALGGSAQRRSDESAAMKAMQSEIQGLRELLREQMKESMAERKPVEAMVQKRLKRMGVSEAFIQRIISAIALDDSARFADAWNKAVEQLRSGVMSGSSDIVEQGGVVAFLGATGAGKTTVIGKLAADYVLKYGADNIALVTTDSYRIAAYEQLRTFGRILGVPVRVVDERNPLESALKALKSKALVLIDTAGLNSHDPAMNDQFRMLESASTRIRKYLVISATSQASVLQSSYDLYKPQGLNGCVVTKLDEAVSGGEAMSLIADNRLPVTYISEGQRIPDDLRSGDSHYLVGRSLELLEMQEAGD